VGGRSGVFSNEFVDVPVDPAILSPSQLRNFFPDVGDLGIGPSSSLIPAKASLDRPVAVTSAKSTSPKSASAKGKSKQARVKPSINANLNDLIRDLLPKDYVGQVPKMSGPFEVLLDAHGKPYLEGPIAHAVSDPVASPRSYIYIANYRAGPEIAADPLANGTGEILNGPLPLATWKISHPLTNEGKERSRGPRRCGYCGRMECKGRGGRNWCPDYKAGRPAKVGGDDDHLATGSYGAGLVRDTSGERDIEIEDDQSLAGDRYSMAEEAGGELTNMGITSMLMNLITPNEGGEEEEVDTSSGIPFVNASNGVDLGSFYSAEGFARQITNDDETEDGSDDETVRDIANLGGSTGGQRGNSRSTTEI
jgi:hypothetical protein